METVATALEAFPPGLFDVAGVIGVAFYLGSYVVLQAGLIGGTGYAYPAMNLAASALVLVSLITEFNLYSAIIQVSWILVSLGGMTRRYALQRRTRFDPDEEYLRAALFSGLDPLVVRRMFDRADWVDLGPGHDFIEEGEAVDALWVLREGEVAIVVQGREITRVHPLVFLGELAVLNGEPSIGTARTTGPTRLWRLPAEQLRAVIGGDQGARLQIEGLLSRASRWKLGNANLRLARAYGVAPPERANGGTPPDPAQPVG